MPGTPLILSPRLKGRKKEKSSLEKTKLHFQSMQKEQGQRNEKPGATFLNSFKMLIQIDCARVF